VRVSGDNAQTPERNDESEQGRVELMHQQVASS
jgi:hypothetical protein